MAVEGTLTMWAELVNSSELTHPESVDKVLNAIGVEDHNYECDGVGWDKDFKIPLKMSITYWDGAPIDLIEELQYVRTYLKKGEFLLFEEKQQCATSRGCNTLRMILVTADDILVADSSRWEQALRECAGLPLELEAAIHGGYDDEMDLD